MPVFNPEYDRKIVDLSWTTNASGTTAVDDTDAFPAGRKCLVHSLWVKGHSWDVAAGGASGCSGATVQFLDDSSRTIYETSEFLTASETLMSGDFMLVGATTVRYAMCDGNNDNRVMSGAGTPWSEWNDPVLIVFTY